MWGLPRDFICQSGPQGKKLRLQLGPVGTVGTALLGIVLGCQEESLVLYLPPSGFRAAGSPTPAADPVPQNLG